MYVCIVCMYVCMYVCIHIGTTKLYPLVEFDLQSGEAGMLQRIFRKDGMCSSILVLTKTHYFTSV